MFFSLTQCHEGQDAVEGGVVEAEGHGQAQRDHEAHEAGHDASQGKVCSMFNLGCRFEIKINSSDLIHHAGSPDS